MVIDKIKFRNVNTNALLRAVQLRSSPVNISEPVSNPVAKKIHVQVIEQKLNRLIKVPFTKLTFQHGSISFLSFIEELGTEIKFEIHNPDLRPEFEAIKDYFVKVLKKKLITSNLEVVHQDGLVKSATAYSEDIDKINSSLVDSVRFEFVKKEILGFKGHSSDKPMFNTLDELTAGSAYNTFYKSDQALIDDILAVKNSKHFHQLKYLSSQHLSGVLRIRFILHPFSFIFLLAGDTKYHIIWETLNSEEATYIWHFEKSLEALRKGLNEIEIILNEIKANSKIDYLKKDQANFSRVIHDYSDAKSGFTSWKGMLEQKIN